MSTTPSQQDGHAGHHDASGLKSFGFWVYIMTDCILFGTIFSAFLVLSSNYAGGVTGRDIFELKGVLVETFCLLFSSITYGFAMVGMHQGKKGLVQFWLAITFLLGAAFLYFELNEFHHLVVEGHDWSHSAFLSAFFTLVSTHGLHVTFGLLWMVIMMVQVAKRGLDDNTRLRLSLLSIFWHFLDIIWIFVFTTVYLMGVING
jgi:cytochrome o ubiquinol oxidase subunit 3